MIIEVEENPNCEESGMWRFNSLGPARLVKRIKLYDRDQQGEWCEVTGWSDQPGTSLCPACAQRVDDSGAGVSILVFGGSWGLRFKPERCQEEWSLQSPNQWGAPYLLISDMRDLVFADGHGAGFSPG